MITANEEEFECVTTARVIHFVPPNSWLDDETCWCPTCHTMVEWGQRDGLLSDRECKLQHQLWHYHVAMVILPDKEPSWYGGTPNKPDRMPMD